MKQACILFWRRLKYKGIELGPDCHPVANVHDEFQIECKKELAETVGQVAVESIKEAGEVFGFRCPLDAEYKIGRNWAETH